jgi:hypothetical protein
MHAVVAGNATLGVVLCLLLALLWRRHRGFVRELNRDHDRGWSTLRKLSVGLIAALIAWASSFDNWRQLTAIPFRATRQWESQRILIDPPSDEVRAVTFVLLATTLVLTGCLIARHVGGYFLQAVIALGAIFAWMPLFVIRTRFSLDLAMGFTGSWTSPGDMTGYLGFAVLTWAFDIALIAVTFTALAALTAIPLTLLLDLTRLRRPRVSKEAVPFFNAIGSRPTS